MRIGILKTDQVREELVDEFGEYPDMFIDLLKSVDRELEFSVYDVTTGQFPEHLHADDAYLITGSKASVYEEQPWIQALAGLVRQLHQARKKLVGVCFGHQLVAQALGGRAEKSDRGWGVGVHAACFARIPGWHDYAEAEFKLLVSHQDQVVEPAPGMEVLAGSDFCENAVCQLGDHILTFQGHPEFVPGYSEQLLKLRRENIGEEKYHAGMDSLSQPIDRERVGRWMVNFLREPVS